jgi:type II restriction/modification system DNA methylase subunit YeeA
MNQTSIRNVATWGRQYLIEAVSHRARVFGVHSETRIDPDQSETADALIINGQVYDKEVKDQRQRLVAEVKTRGFQEVIDEVAYTWFNRLIALRFMEVNHFLPTGVRVLSSSDPEKKEPDLMTQALGVDLKVDHNEVNRLLDAHREEDLYKLLLVAQCNALHPMLPSLFEEINDYTELLLPSGLLHPGGLIDKLVNDIPEDDWKEIEIVGWLYQYYIKDKKDAVIGKMVKKEDIPAATQLFTPRWIVEYMVQNSLGRLWMEMYPESDLRGKMAYYVENPDDKDLTRDSMPLEEIKCLDDACGSGHILVVMFDLLYEMYLERGYVPREIPLLILTHNLVGIDIDRRACQLASFALEMKARDKDRRFFDRQVRPRIIEIVESNDLDPESAVNLKRKELEVFINPSDGQGDLFSKESATQQELFEADPQRADWAEALAELVKLFHDAKNYGSLLTVPESLSRQLPRLKKAAQEWCHSDDPFARQFGESLLPLIDQAEALAAKYHAVVANPPYMGGKGQNPKLKDFLKKNFKDYKSDSFAAFIKRNLNLTLPNGHLGFVTPYVWMFLSSYESLRRYIFENSFISTLVQLEYNAFEPACIPVCSFSLKKQKGENCQGSYIRLSDFKGHQNQAPKTLEAIENPNCGWFHRASAADFAKIPGSPVAYWVSDKVRGIFENSPSISTKFDARAGLQTGDTQKFLRRWYEVSSHSIGYGHENKISAEKSMKKWFTYNKGGDFRKWWGNLEYVVNWEKDGMEIKNYRDESGKLRSRPQNLGYYFKKSLTWTDITSSTTAARIIPTGIISDVVAPCAYALESSSIENAIRFVNSKVVQHLISIINPTMHFHVGCFGVLPIIGVDDDENFLFNILFEIARADWDNFETSWDFTDLPLLREGLKGETLEASWKNWERQLHDNIARMQELETENNRLWIDAYGLQDELTPEVPEKEITLARPNLGKDMAAFVSYAIGCMMGRYSLDKPGLILADAGDGIKQWEAKVGKDHSCAIFPVDDDGIIPVLDEEYFTDDCAARLFRFIEVTFGKVDHDKNLDFLANALVKVKPTETSRQAIRRYLATGFYKDHLQTYKKRPIYWLFSSGKEKAFQALVYLHRYTPETLSKLRTDYLHELQNKLMREEIHLESESEQDGKEGLEARKRLEKLRRQLVEIKQYDEKLRHLAEKRIELDLDDGVKVNYAKMEDLVV